jgi:hypothetical protein
MPLYYPPLALTLGGNTTGTATIISNGTATLAGGNNITLSMATAGGNAITIVGGGYQGYQGYQGASGFQGAAGTGTGGGGGAAFSLVISGNTAGTTASVSSGTMTLVGGNNITLSQNNNAITINANLLTYYNPISIPGTAAVTYYAMSNATSGSMSLYPFQVIEGMAAEYAGIVVSMNFATIGTAAMSHTSSLQWGIYSRATGSNSTQLSLMGSNSLSIAYTYNNSSMTFNQVTTTNASGVYSTGSTSGNNVSFSSGYTGQKLILLGLNSTILPGQYWLGLHQRGSTSGSQGGLAISLQAYIASGLSGLAPFGSFSSNFNSGTALGDVVGGPWCLGGYYSVPNMTGLTNQITLSQMTISLTANQIVPTLFFATRI